MPCHDHHYVYRTVEEPYNPPHTGSWGGIRVGHTCCGQCRGQPDRYNTYTASDDRCQNVCRGVCNDKTYYRTKKFLECSKCGNIIEQQ